jgi:hypothetical protein
MRAHGSRGAWGCSVNTGSVGFVSYMIEKSINSLYQRWGGSLWCFLSLGPNRRPLLFSVWFELRALFLISQALYHLNYTSSPFSLIILKMGS